MTKIKKPAEGGGGSKGFTGKGIPGRRAQEMEKKNADHGYCINSRVIPFYDHQVKKGTELWKGTYSPKDGWKENAIFLASNRRSLSRREGEKMWEGIGLKGLFRRGRRGMRRPGGEGKSTQNREDEGKESKTKARTWEKVPTEKREKKGKKSPCLKGQT